MSDFFQNGMITTLQKLDSRPLGDLEDELRELAQSRRIALLLPSLYSELKGPAMPRILESLAEADYLERIILSLDCASELEFRCARERMAGLPVRVEILWNDGPRQASVRSYLENAGLTLGPQGKGRGVWLAMGYALADPTIDVVVTHDCDIVNYSREILARLVYPVVHPELAFDFAKGYYPRVSSRLYGRVTRLFLTPFLRSLQELRLACPALEFFDSFRYALAGEFAMSARLARRVPLSPTWGLEVSLLGEVFAAADCRSICQVEIAENYEHKHQDLGCADGDSGLCRMVGEIARTLLIVLSRRGTLFSDACFRSLPLVYRAVSQRHIEHFDALSKINGLPYDRGRESAAAELFVAAIERAIEAFREAPSALPLLPAWSHAAAVADQFGELMKAAIRQDKACLDPVEPHHGADRLDLVRKVV